MHFVNIYIYGDPKVTNCFKMLILFIGNKHERFFLLRYLGIKKIHFGWINPNNKNIIWNIFVISERCRGRDAERDTVST